MTLSLQSSMLAESPGVRHGFFTRQGGVSTGIYASLNCGPGSADQPESVAANREMAMAELGLPASALCTVYQVHGCDVVTLEAPLPAGERPKADGLVTATPGLALGILAADCSPLLFADTRAGVIGACHAGWRGALYDVAEATIAAMEKLGARRAAIVGAIGPTIAQRSYEVGPEFPGPFLAEDPANEKFFAASPRQRHFQFDLPGYIEAKLRRLKIGLVDNLRRDTFSDPDRFYSYRRTTHAQEPDYGRQLSTIALVGDRS